MVVGMIALFLITGVGQDPLQFVHPVSEYARLLLANPPALRATIGLDNLFIAFYATSFVGLAILLVRQGASRAPPTPLGPPGASSRARASAAPFWRRSPGVLQCALEEDSCAQDSYW
jgi:hypothetical protein